MSYENMRSGCASAVRLASLLTLGQVLPKTRHAGAGGGGRHRHGLRPSAPRCGAGGLSRHRSAADGPPAARQRRRLPLLGEHARAVRAAHPAVAAAGRGRADACGSEHDHGDSRAVAGARSVGPDAGDEVDAARRARRRGQDARRPPARDRRAAGDDFLCGRDPGRAARRFQAALPDHRQRHQPGLGAA